MNVIFSKRRLFLTCQAIMLIIGILVTMTMDFKGNHFLILLFSIWNIFIYGWMFVQEMKYAPDFQPYQILLLVCVQFVGLNGISIYNNLEAGIPLKFGMYVIDDVVFLGLLYLSIQHLILFYVFYKFEKRRLSKKTHNICIMEQISRSNIDYAKWAMISYVLVWTLRALSYIIPLVSLGAFIVNLSSYGYMLSLFFLLFATIKNPKRTGYMKWHWIIVVIEIFIVFSFGMKELIIRAFIPYCVYIIIMYKGGSRRINLSTLRSLAIIGTFVVLFVFPYVSLLRDISSSSGREWKDVSTTEVLDEYFSYLDGTSRYVDEEGNKSTDYLMSRAGSIGCNAWCVYYAQQNGPTPKFIQFCALGIIPRALWPDKPAMVIGGMIARLSIGDESWLKADETNEYHNSASFGFIGSCYFSLGFWGAILLIIAHSVFLWIQWDFCRKRLYYHPLALWCFISSVFVLLKDFEAYQDCGIGVTILAVGYMLLSKFVFTFSRYK